MPDTEDWRYITLNDGETVAKIPTRTWAPPIKCGKYASWADENETTSTPRLICPRCYEQWGFGGW